jgi:hypothetical protein
MGTCRNAGMPGIIPFALGFSGKLNTENKRMHKR